MRLALPPPVSPPTERQAFEGTFRGLHFLRSADFEHLGETDSASDLTYVTGCVSFTRILTPTITTHATAHNVIDRALRTLDCGPLYTCFVGEGLGEVPRAPTNLPWTPGPRDHPHFCASTRSPDPHGPVRENTPCLVMLSGISHPMRALYSRP